MNAITAMVDQLNAAQNSRLTGAPLISEIKRLARTGTSQRAIAHRLGVSRTYVFGVLRKARES
jgi:transposase-like protein